MTNINQALTTSDNSFPNEQPVNESNYQAVHYNAMTHGILSRCTVLPHEDRNEYNDLLLLLNQEHQPQGITEAHLIEELAGIIWRKQRVLQAEGTKINEGLKSSLAGSSLLSSSLPLHSGMSRDGFNIAELLRMTPDEADMFHQTASDELESIRQAKGILDADKPNYKKALTCLCEEDQGWWDQTIEDEENDPTAADLLAFILEHLKPWYERQMTVAEHLTEIKAQAFGGAIQPHRIEKLNRYETHLDRKFQRTLAMLIKLKELRNAQAPN